MNWKYLFIGIGFFIAAFFLYKSRKSGNYSGELAFVNKVKVFRVWMIIIMGLIAGLVLIFKSLPN